MNCILQAMRLYNSAQKKHIETESCVLNNLNSFPFTLNHNKLLFLNHLLVLQIEKEELTFIVSDGVMLSDTVHA